MEAREALLGSCTSDSPVWLAVWERRVNAGWEVAGTWDWSNFGALMQLRQGVGVGKEAVEQLSAASRVESWWLLESDN